MPRARVIQPSFANPPGYQPPEPAEAREGGFLNAMKAMGDIGVRYAGQELAGDAEVLAAMGTGMYGAAESGWAGLASGGDTELMDKVMEKRTYMPRTEAGQRKMQALGNAMVTAGEKLLPMREWTEKHANALLPLPMAAGIYAGLAGAAEFLPVPGGKGTGRAVKQVGRFIPDELSPDQQFAALTLKHDPSAIGQIMTSMRGGPKVDKGVMDVPTPPEAGAYPTTTAGRIRNKTVNEGGYTVNMQSGQVPDDGLMMGKYPNEGSRTQMLTGKVTASDIRGFVTANANDLKKLDLYLGTWRDGGDFYLDIARRFEPNDIRRATKFGEETNQLAGYNLGAQQDFPVGNWRAFIESPEFKGRLLEMRKVGKEYLASHPTDEWWDLHGTLLERIYGKENLEVLAGFIASTAPNTNPTMNMRMASEYMRRHLIGEPIIQPDYRIPDTAVARTPGVMLGMEAGRVRNLNAAAAGDINQLRKEKVRNEALALTGDPNAMVFDRHWARVAEDPQRGIFTASKPGEVVGSRKFEEGNYEVLEDAVRPIAEQLGEYPRNFTADVWTGIRETIKNTGELYGVKYRKGAITGESKGYADIADDLIEAKAKRAGMSRKQFEDELSRGNAELLSLVLATPFGAWMFSQAYGTSDNNDPTPGTSRPAVNALASGRENL